MFNLGEVAPQHEVVTKRFEILGHETEVTYFRNKLTMEDTRRSSDDGDDGEADEDGDTANSVASRVCGLVKSWDWRGPLAKLDGTVVVESGQEIPLSIDIVRLIPLRLTKALNEAIVEAELGGNGKKRRQR